MRLKVLVVPDKFKGTLTASAAAEALARGWRRARPGDELELLPMSDGGDGFGEVIRSLIDAVPQRLQACDAAHRDCIARWWWQPNTRTAVLETANIIGLAMLPPGRYHPFKLDTYGLGKVIEAAAAKGAKRLLVGLGGSATNDGGFGLARSLGWEFLNSHREPIERWVEVLNATRLQTAKAFKAPFEVIAAVDVQNPLLGPIGATCVYGPQKGLKPTDFPLAEKCLARLASLINRAQRTDWARVAGAGAAGGLGFAFAAFLGGRLEPGFELFAREAKLERRLRWADLVLTGEGAVDRSTFMGKGAGQIVRRCRALGIPCIVLAGCIDGNVPTRLRSTRIHALAQLTTRKQAKAQPAVYLRRLAELVARNWTGK